MAILAITGATGFIGRHVVPFALEHGHHVRAIVRPGSESKLPKGAGALTGEVTDRTSVESLVCGAEIVIHLAGVAHTSLRTEADRRRAIDVNVGGTQNVLDAAQRNGVHRVVLASSAQVYAGQRGEQVREDAPQAAENLYAQTKIEIERLARTGSGVEVVIARPCLTYGPNAGFNLLKLMGAINRGRYFHIGNKPVVRSFASVYCVAAAVVHLAERGIPGEAYNIADQEPIVLERFVNSLADEMKRSRPRHVPYPLAWTAAAGFSALTLLGIPGPITLEALHKVTDSFSISTEKLAASGFVWIDSGSRARHDMVQNYLAGTQ